MRDIIGAWLITLGVLTLVWVVLAELAIRRAERRKRAAEIAHLPPLIVAYDAACSPHPWPSERVVWVSTNTEDEAWSVMAGGIV